MAEAESTKKDGALTDCSDEETAAILWESSTYGKGEHEAALTQEEMANQILGRGVINRLYNMKVDFEIPVEGRSTPIRFSVRGVLDTGATSCCIKESIVPKEDNREHFSRGSPPTVKIWSNGGGQITPKAWVGGQATPGRLEEVAEALSIF
jgi:hypothetical protein